MTASQDRRRLGRTNLHLTALGFGTAGLGNLFDIVDEPTAHATLVEAWDGGCRYIDTSPFYGHGLAELRSGRGLHGRNRADFVLSTKVGRLFGRPDSPAGFTSEGWIGGLPLKITYDYSYDGIMRSVEDSYIRLGMNQIDILFVHDLDSWFHTDPETLAFHRRSLLSSGWKALDELRTSAVVGAIGAGLNDRETMGWYLDNLDPDTFLLALRYTLLEHDVLYSELPRCEAAGIGIVVGGAFNSGVLATGAVDGARFNYAVAPDEVLKRVRRIQTICDRHEVLLAAAALQFCAAHPLVGSVVVGALSQKHVQANIKAFETEIPSQFWADLKAEDLIARNAPTPL